MAGSGQHTITYSYTEGTGEVISISNNTVVDPIPEIVINNGEIVYCVTDINIPLDVTPYGGEWSGEGVNDFTDLKHSSETTAVYIGPRYYLDQHAPHCACNAHVKCIFAKLSIENVYLAKC